MNVFLIGVDHRIQWLPKQFGSEWHNELKLFADYLHRECLQKKAGLIAEEFSDEALSRSNAENSIARIVSDRLGVQHMFCDPDSLQCASHRISTHSEREEYWLTRLLSAKQQVVLFICGDTHTKPFLDLLKSRGHDASILSSGWGRDWMLKS